MTLTSLLAFVSTAILARRKEPEPESFVCKRCGIKSYNPNDIRERYCGRCHEFDAMADLKKQIEELKAENRVLLQHLATERDLRIDATRRLLDARASLLLQADRFSAFYLGGAPQEHAIRDPGHFGFCTCVPGRSAMFRHFPIVVDTLRDALDGE
jgi:ribosomal protein L37E